MKFTHSIIGDIHLLSALAAMITGTMVLVLRKGTKNHKYIGYGYFISMLILNVTALMIFRLFGGFGIFHIAALISLLTIIFGFIPIIRRKSPKWILHHFSWMYWSVIGLYAAFVSEVITRVPQSPFFWMVGIGTFLVIGAGSYFFRKNSPKWEKQFYKPK